MVCTLIRSCPFHIWFSHSFVPVRSISHSLSVTFASVTLTRYPFLAPQSFSLVIRIFRFVLFSAVPLAVLVATPLLFGGVSTDPLLFGFEGVFFEDLSKRARRQLCIFLSCLPCSGNPLTALITALCRQEPACRSK